MIPTMIEQVEALQRNRTSTKSVTDISPSRKSKSGAKEREQRRIAIYNKMKDGNIYTSKDLQKIFGWDIREITSTVNVLVSNGFVKNIGETKINGYKVYLYKAVK